MIKGVLEGRLSRKVRTVKVFNFTEATVEDMSMISLLLAVRNQQVLLFVRGKMMSKIQHPEKFQII